MAPEPDIRNFSTDQLGAVLDAALDCIICMDRHGLVREWNPAAERTFGYSREQAVGSELASLIIPPELRERHRHGMAHYLATGEGPVLGQRVEVPGMHADGSRLLVELAITTIRSDEGPFFTAYLRDITARERNERRRSVQYAVASLLSGARRIEEVGSEALAAIASLADWQFGSIWLCNGECALLHPATHWQAEGRDFATFRELSSTTAMQAGTGLPGQVLASGEPRWVRDFARDNRFPRAEAAQRDGLHAAFAFPLSAGGKTLGVVEFFGTEVQSPDEDLVRFSTALGEHIGQFLERQRAEEQLQEQRRIADEQRRLAEEANAAKDRFIAVLSHELRTPLTPVLFWACSSLEDQALPAELREDLRMVRRNIELEARLIDDLLEFTRLGHGQSRIERTLQSAHDVLQNALTNARMEADRKQLHLTADLGADSPQIQADALRLQQVFRHVLHNACKFTPTGGAISVRTWNPSPELVRIEITDTGAGIPAEILPRLFSPFEQGGKEQFGGLGLGLAIAKMIVERHDGTFEAFSRGADQGATFTIDLPVAKTSELSQGTLDPGDAGRSAVRKLRILVVEDHENTLQMLTRILRRAGHDVATAANVQSALEAVSAREFDLILSDLGLPDGTGWDVIREAQRRQGVAGIALSGFNTEEDVRRSLEAGFSAHLTKPVDLDDLKRAIQAFALRRGSTDVEPV